MTSISFVIAASILGVLPASAVGAGVDQRSDHAALTAYRDCLQGIVRSLSGKLKGIATTGATKILNTLRG
jgi:hypothetical protein